MQGGGRHADMLGHYRILERLGSGASADVYRALDVTLDREVALKVLNADALSEEGARRLRREARVLARLNHPNVETVYEVGQEKGVEYLAVELVAGPTLADLARRAPLPEPEVRALAAQLADGLAAAHAQGVVHCDLKPANLRLTAEGRLKILDFGIARLRREQLAATLSTVQTQEEAFAIAGTPAYMAPEQLDGRADERTDVYAAGAVLYELATGRRPFEAPEVTALLHAVTTQDPQPVRRLNPTLSDQLGAVIHTALRKAPKARFPTAVALREALEGRAAIPRAGRRGGRRWALGMGLVALLLTAAVGIAGGVGVFGASHPASGPLLRERRLTAFPDDVGVGTMVPSRDGGEIVYEAGGRVWRRAVEGGLPTPLLPPKECEGLSVRGILRDHEGWAGNCGRSRDGRMETTPAVFDGHGGWEPLAAEGKLEKVAPDGVLAQMSRDSGVYVRHLGDGTERRVLTLGPTEQALCSSWSPDSGYLALGIVGVTDGGFASRIEVVTSDGRRGRVIPADRLLQPVGVCGLAWTAADTLVYAAMDDAGSGSELWEIHLSEGDWDGRPPRRLHAWPDASVDWFTHSAGRLFFVKNAGGQADLRVIDVEDSTQALERTLRATRNDTHDAGAWTPDGRLYFQSNRYGTWDAFVKAPEELEPELVAGGPADELFDAALDDGSFLLWRLDRTGDGPPPVCRLMEASRPGGALREVGTYGTAFVAPPMMAAPCPTVWCARGARDRCLLVTYGATEITFQRIDLGTGSLDEAFRRPTPTTSSYDISPDGRAFVLTPPDRAAVAVVDIETGETVERRVEMPPGLEDATLLDAGWAQDGSGWYAVENVVYPKRLLFIDADTFRARVVVESNTPEFMRWPWNSPDGRRLVVTTFRRDVDVWVLEGLD